MKFLSLLCLAMLLPSLWGNAEAARDMQAELQSIQEQKQLIKKAQHDLNLELGQVGKNLKQLDIALLQARQEYRDVRKALVTVDKHLQELALEKENINKRMEDLYQQMVNEASIAYQRGRTQSIWVDILSDTSITEIPHRQFLLKSAMLAQEKDRQVWRVNMAKLALVEQEEQANKDKLIVLQEERKNAEQALVSKITDKRNAAKQLRSSIQSKKAQEKRLALQEKALKRLLDGLGDTLLASDKKTQALSIRKSKGKLPWPIKGNVMVAFGQQTSTGVKLAGVHIAPEKRSESGKLVHALGQGQVRYADWFGGYGLMMIVDYGHGIMAVYAHNDALHKQIGDWVEKDEILAEAGSTGWIDDVRLYFEIRDEGKSVNPARWCTK